ncbi:Flp pilus assembly CpaE family ATPase [Evansella vedderi]|uniref:Flp pilus assembly CpaE family ATPase n=1 Tax=Evansella vedderi TaxID=38282 RepID=A0ABT9ZXN2_9BACI|nr:hypothetical protein [Evansella vedderi]MDQ0255491.1 Flp pilus assembly CpaE family ATPase [Evansella vedderi]
MVVEKQPKKIIIAIPNSKFAEGLKKHFERKNFKVIEIVVVLEHLMETLEMLEEEGESVDGLLISSDIAKKMNNKRLELFSDTLLTLREKYSHMSIVVLSNEGKGHPVLAEIVSMGIYNIFVKSERSTLDVQGVISAFDTPVPFSEVSHYREFDRSIQWRTIETQRANRLDFPKKIENKRIEEDGDNNSDKQTIYEKKIINKQVVKKEFKFNITNQGEKVVGVPIEAKIILIGSFMPRSGTSFVAHNLTKYISDLGVGVSYIENPFQKAYTYDLFIGHEKAPAYISKFYYYTEGSSDKHSDKTTKWKEGNINWVVKNPTLEPDYTESDIDDDDMFKLLLSLRSTPIIIFDVGEDWGKEIYQSLYDIADEVFLIVQPDIPNIQYYLDSQKPHHEFLRKIDKSEKVTWIGNQVTKRMLKTDVMKELSEYMIDVPSFNSEYTYQSQFEGISVFDNNDCKKVIEDSYYPIIQKILPHEFLKKRKKGFFEKLFNKKSISVTSSNAQNEGEIKS